MRGDSLRVTVYWTTAVSAVLLAYALRINTLALRSLWFDEVMEYWVASAPLSEILPSVKTALQDPPLYSLILHFWQKVGHTEFSIRYLSLVFSMLALLGTATFARLTSGSRARLLVTVLMAVAVPDIRFAQEAGQYALMLCLLAWFLVCVSQLVAHGGPRYTLLTGLTAAAAVYCYYGTALTIIGTFGVFLAKEACARQHKKLTDLLVAVVIFAVATLPLTLCWLPVQLFRGPSSGIFQVSFGTVPEELRLFVQQTQDLLTFQILGYQPGGWPWPTVPSWIVWLPAVLLITLSVARKGHRLPGILLIANLLICYIAGRLGAYPYGGRYSLILTCLFWASIAASVADTSVKGQSLLHQMPALVLIGLVFLASLSTPREPQEDLKSVTQFWVTRHRENDLTYVYYGAVPGFRYEISLADEYTSVPALWYTRCWEGLPQPYCSENGIAYGRWLRGCTTEQWREAIYLATGSSAERVWLVFSHVHANEDAQILAALNDMYKVTTNFAAENASVYLLEQR